MCVCVALVTDIVESIVPIIIKEGKLLRRFLLPGVYLHVAFGGGVLVSVIGM